MGSRFASNLHTFGYESGDSEVIWDVADIWKAAEQLKVKRMPLEEFRTYIEHIRRHYDKEDETRIREADLSYPPIISSGYTTVEIVEGSMAKVPLIIDGCHRLAKMIDLDKKWVDVKIMQTMPTPLYVKGKPFSIEGLNFTWRAKSVSNESFTQDVKWLEW